MIYLPLFTLDNILESQQNWGNVGSGPPIVSNCPVLGKTSYNRGMTDDHMTDKRREDGNAI